MFTAYFSITNASIVEPAFANIGSGSTGSGANLARVTITSSNFKNTTMHRSVVRDGLSKIEPVEKKTIQPGQTRACKRGCYRLILMQPSAWDKIGKSTPLRMKLQSGRKATVTCKARRH